MTPEVMTHSPLFLDNDVPEGWQRVQLGEVAQISGGTTPKRSESTYWDGDIPWARPSDLTARPPGKLMLASTEEMMTDLALEETSASVLPPQSVLMTSRATIGEVAINTVPMATNQGFCNFVPEEQIDPRFLAYWLSANTERLRRLAAGSTFKELAKDDARQVRIDLPPLHEQKQIAAAINTIDAVSGMTHEVMWQTRNTRKRVVHKLVSQGIDHHQHKETEIGRVPRQWKVVPLSDVLVSPGLRNGISPATNSGSDGIPSFSIEALRRGRLAVDKDTIKYADAEPDEVEGYRLCKGDVLLIRGNANPELVGRAGLADKFPEGSIYPDILIRVTLDTERILPGFFVEAWNSPKIRRQIRSIAQTTSGTLKINQRQTRRVRIPLPPLREQRKILQSLPSTLDEKYQEYLERLALLKQGVAQDLLTGRVRVNTS